MDMEMNEDLGVTLDENEHIDRLTAAASQLEQTIAHLEEKLAAAEQQLIALEARATAPRADVGARKTLPTAMTTLLAKQGVSFEAASLEAGALDAALASLSIEQRIAVKAQLLRAGLVS
jgi:phage shock protein A